jgi:Mitochondrial ribosomal protein (VAR1)
MKNIESRINNIYSKLDSNKYVLDSIKKIFYMNLKKTFMCQFYVGILYLTNHKFNINNLTELKDKLYKIYKKKINIKIINLKYLYLENTIFLDAIMNKLNDRKNRALTVIRKGLGLARIVKLHPLFYRTREVEKNDSNKEFNSINKILNKKLFNLDSNKYTDILSYLKNKHVSGLRIEAKGRLTKRLTASRAVYKISYKGSLKNIYSSYNKLSTIILRGLSKSNTEYVNTNSKNRNGSYGVKY